MQRSDPEGLHQHLNGIFAITGEHNQWKDAIGGQ